MPLLLNQLEWSEEPLAPETHDPAWEDELRAAMGMVPGSFKRIAASPAVRETYLDCVRCPTAALGDSEIELAGLVTSQENACRFCYGMARTRMKMIGFSDEMIDRIERNVQLVEADPKERELVRFCRNLARSKPRPSRQAYETLMSVGYERLQIVELAFVVAAVGYCNRVSTLLAIPPEIDFERIEAKGFWNKLSAWLPGKRPPVRPPPGVRPAPTFAGPFGALVRNLEASPAAAVLEAALKAAFTSTVLPARTVALMFAVVARTLECQLCESRAGTLLEAEGLDAEALGDVLTALDSPRLTETERLLIPWTRDTVWMPEQPARIQQKTRPLLDTLGARVLLEAVGAAALANSCVRLTMLEV